MVSIEQYMSEQQSYHDSLHGHVGGVGGGGGRRGRGRSPNPGYKTKSRRRSQSRDEETEASPRDVMELMPSCSFHSAASSGTAPMSNSQANQAFPLSPRRGVPPRRQSLDAFLGKPAKDIDEDMAKRFFDDIEDESDDDDDDDVDLTVFEDNFDNGSFVSWKDTRKNMRKAPIQQMSTRTMSTNSAEGFTAYTAQSPSFGDLIRNDEFLSKMTQSNPFHDTDEDEEDGIKGPMRREEPAAAPAPPRRGDGLKRELSKRELSKRERCRSPNRPPPLQRKNSSYNRCRSPQKPQTRKKTETAVSRSLSPIRKENTTLVFRRVQKDGLSQELTVEANNRSETMLHVMERVSPFKVLLKFGKKVSKAIKRGEKQVLFVLKDIHDIAFTPEEFGRMRVGDLLMLTPKRPISIDIVVQNIRGGGSSRSPARNRREY